MMIMIKIIFKSNMCQLIIDINQLLSDCSGKESKISATVSEIDRKNLGLCLALLGGGAKVPNFSHLSESSAYSPQKKLSAFELVDSINSSTVSISFSEHLALPLPLSWKHLRKV